MPHVCFLFSQNKSGKAVLTQLQPPCDAVVDSQKMVAVAVWQHQKRHIVGMQEEEGGRNQSRRVSPLPHLGELTRIRPSVQRPAAVQAAEAFRQRFQSKGPDCNPVWAPGAEDKAPRNNVPKKPAKRTTTPGAVNTDLRNSQKKPRLNDEEVFGQPVTASFDTDALAAAVYNTLCAKLPPAWFSGNTGGTLPPEYHNKMMALSRELREQKAYQLLYLQHLELEALVNKNLPSTSVPDSIARLLYKSVVGVEPPTNWVAEWRATLPGSNTPKNGDEDRSNPFVLHL